MKKLAAIVLVLWSALVCAAFAPLYVPAINVVSTNDPCASLDSSTTALVARMTVDPGCPRKVVINNLIVSLKTAGVWAKLDVLYLFAAHDSQAALLNWVSTSYNASTVNSPAFTTDRGFQGNGSSSYLSSNFNPATASSPKFIQNSAHVSVWNRSSNYTWGGDVGSSNVQLRPLYDSSFTFYQVNSNSQTVMTPPTTAGTKHQLARRSGASATAYFAQGSMQHSDTTSSSTPGNATINFLNYSTTYSNHQLASGSIGASLTDTEIADFSNALQTYMTAVGA